MTNVIDLRPDRKLLNSNFEKYQFCADEIPVICEKKLDTEILRLELSSSRDSWLEARLFAFHNHLFKNPYTSTCWFIDKNGGFWKFKINGVLENVYTSSIVASKSDNCLYNPSIAFASKDIFIISNGGGTLEFLFKKQGSIKGIPINNVDPAVILDANVIQETSNIIVALYKIEENKGKRFSRLIFLTYSYDDKSNLISVNLIKKQTMKVKGSIEFVYIETNGKFCQIVSQDPVEFDYDSVNPIQSKKENTKTESKINIPKYCWSQDESQVTVYIKLPEKYKEFSEANIDVKPFYVSISVGDTTLLSGETTNRMDHDLTTYKIKNGTIEIDLCKNEIGLMWSELLKGDTGGEYVPNNTLTAEIHSRLSHLCSDQQESNTLGQPAIGFNSEQLEDCDISEAENILQRINIDSHVITHMAMLGCNNRVLFTDKRISSQIVCLRHDHDGCLWKLKESNDDTWNPEHIHTFPGFGYIEASKTNKQFCVCPPDASYTAIVEHTRHAFVYEKPKDNAIIGKQRIVDFGTEISAILGAASTNKYLIVLTKDAIYQLQVYS